MPTEIFATSYCTRNPFHWVSWLIIFVHCLGQVLHPTYFWYIWIVLSHIYVRTGRSRAPGYLGNWTIASTIRQGEVKYQGDITNTSQDVVMSVRMLPRELLIIKYKPTCRVGQSSPRISRQLENIQYYRTYRVRRVKSKDRTYQILARIQYSSCIQLVNKVRTYVLLVYRYQVLH